MILTASGGVALFLWGIMSLSDALEDSLAERAKYFMKNITGSIGAGFLIGLVVTVILQSSSLTTVLVISMVNAKVLTLKEASAIIVGANVGTTVTAHLVSFDLQKMALPLFTAGFLMSLLPVPRIRQWGRITINFSILLLGFNFMVEGLSPLSELEAVREYLKSSGEYIWKGISGGFLTTAIVQSSSAVMGIALAMAREGNMEVSTAMAFFIGADIGTCVTALLAAVRTGRNARMVALFHLSFNLFNMLIVLPWLNLFVKIASSTSPYLPRQLANAHTLYNLWGALFVLLILHIIFYLSGQMKENSSRPPF
ncbi:MAG: Na/Pi cotransporter family protein [Firmicutes bacterium]|nr:Na/Pi cotransporter family protein [Bacillota bacterium]